MVLRLIHVFLPGKEKKRLAAILGKHTVIDTFYEELDKKAVLARIVIYGEHAEPLFDDLEKNFSKVDGFRVLVSSIEAAIPRPEPPQDEGRDITKREGGQGKELKPVSAGKRDEKANLERISREELYMDVMNQVRLSRVYIVMVVLSSIVASIGILENNVAVIIGAMVIAPLLGPNLALSLATTLADSDLARKAVRKNAIGLLTAFGFSVVLGLLLHVDASIPQIASRTGIGLGDLILALASGSAAAISLTSGVAASLIGVMVAVALLPPLVTAGLLLGSGNLVGSWGAMLLLAANLICVNLAGVLTFILQGIRPLTWWEAKKARKATYQAILLWVCLLAVLILIISLSVG